MNKFQQNCFNTGAPVVATTSTLPPQPTPAQKKRRRQKITDDDDVEVIALSLKELIAVPMFPCELCNKSFTREQNLLLHRRVHNIPYVHKNLPKKINDDEKRKVYVCPVTTCAYHVRYNALSDLPSLRKHYKRKHGEKTMNCTKCKKMYAIEGDLKAHLKICGTKEYACNYGSVFSRWDSFVTHRTTCDRALDHHMSSLQNELIQTSQTTAGSSFAPIVLDESISNYPQNQCGPESNTTTREHSFSSGCSILTSRVSNFLPSNQSVHQNLMTFDLVANNNNTQGNDNIFDVNVLHDRLFGVSSLPAQEAPQQGYTLGNSGNLVSLMGSLENSVAAGIGNKNFDVYANSSGTYENPHQLIYHKNNINNNVFSLQNEAIGGSDPLLGEYCNTLLNENFFGTNLEYSAMQNGGPSGFDHNQINQLVQFPIRRVGGDNNFPMLQNDFHF